MAIIITDDNLMRAKDYSPRTKLYAYKAVGPDGHGPYYAAPQGVPYKVGGVYEQRQCNRNPRKSCGVGLHVATRQWIRQNIERESYSGNKKMALVSFTSADIGCIPWFCSYDYLYSRKSFNKTKAEGKFRVTRFKIEKWVRW